MNVRHRGSILLFSSFAAETLDEKCNQVVCAGTGPGSTVSRITNRYCVARGTVPKIAQGIKHGDYSFNNSFFTIY
jgi:hypothetical protein